MDQRKFVYDFEEGSKEMKTVLGGKGAGLAEMTKIGLPVPPGFTISTEMCPEYLKVGDIPETLKNEIREHLARLEGKLGKKFGSVQNPLLVSVRSGAAVSMPGMMDTILNLGLNIETVEGLATLTGNPRFAWDSYRRFTQMYGNVVLGIEHNSFETILAEQKQLQGATLDTDLSVDSLKALVQKYFALATFDRELHVLHVTIVLFEKKRYFDETLVRFRYLDLHLVDILGRTNAGDDVLTLSIYQILSREALDPGGIVTGETDARCRVVAHVAEDHGLNRDCCTDETRYLLDLSVGDGSLGIP